MHRGELNFVQKYYEGHEWGPPCTYYEIYRSGGKHLLGTIFCHDPIQVSIERRDADAEFDGLQEAMEYCKKVLEEE